MEIKTTAFAVSEKQQIFNFDILDFKGYLLYKKVLLQYCLKIGNNMQYWPKYNTKIKE